MITKAKTSTSSTSTNNVVKCSICGREIYDSVHDSHNAFPFKGKCCNECNIEKVIPIRIALSQGCALLFLKKLKKLKKSIYF